MIFKMNCKLLAIWTSVILILWILLLYIVNMEKINKIKEDFINTSGTCSGKTIFDNNDCKNLDENRCIEKINLFGIKQCNWIFYYF